VAEAVEKNPEAQQAVTPRRSRGYGGRFVVAYLLVMVLFGGMIVLFAVLVSRSDSSSHWSSYKPSGRDQFDKAQNMANYVAPRYVYQGYPIAVVEAQPPIVRDRVVEGIALTHAPLRDIGSHYKQFERADETMFYVFCGQGNRCALPESTATDVVPMLRRESLELALYTFKYWPNISSIVSLLPPTKGSQPAIFLKRKDLESQLAKPLGRTLPTRPVITADSMTLGEQATVEKLTADNIYSSSFQELANGSTLLLLGSGSR
jgi:hypothetical protein